MGTEVLETFASERIPRTVCEGSLVPGCPHLGAPQVFAPSHNQGRLIMTTVLTKPRSHPASQNPHWYTAATGGGARLRRGRHGARWSAVSQRGEGALDREQGATRPGEDQRASADQATMPAKSPDFKLCHRTLDQLLSHPIIFADGAPDQVGTKLSVKTVINKDQ